MEEKILFQYAYESPRSWEDIQAFARAQLATETGLSVDHFGSNTEGGREKLVRLLGFLQRVEGTAKHRVVSDYLYILEGSQFHQSVRTPFPKPSILMSTAPLSQAKATGEILMPLRGAVQGMQYTEALNELYGGDEKIGQFVSWSLVKAHVEKAMTHIDGCTPHILLNYLSLNGPLPPHIERGLRGILEKTFRTVLPDFAPPAIADGAKPH